jgi:putative heme-binding domain-containing protein
MRAFVGLVVLLAAPLLGQHEKQGEKSKHPAIGDPKAIEAGRKLFASGCAACHGAEGQGGRGPNLRAQVFWHPLDDDTLFTSIQKGIGGAMPAANLPEEQVWQVVAYVRSLTSPAAENPPAGDVSAGEALFFGSAGCANCHRVRGKGGMLGPDLSNAGMRAMPDLRDAIVDPDADGAPGYRAVTLTLRSGKTLKGVARNRTNYSMQLQDAQGNLHLIRMEDVAEMTISRGSPMPKDYAKRLSRQQIDDLIAYLSRLTVRPAEVARN